MGATPATSPRTRLVRRFKRKNGIGAMESTRFKGGGDWVSHDMLMGLYSSSVLPMGVKVRMGPSRSRRRRNKERGGSHIGTDIAIAFEIRDILPNLDLLRSVCGTLRPNFCCVFVSGVPLQRHGKASSGRHVKPRIMISFTS